MQPSLFSSSLVPPEGGRGAKIGTSGGTHEEKTGAGSGSAFELPADRGATGCAGS
jgi:hypothetical protein